MPLLSSHCATVPYWGRNYYFICKVSRDLFIPPQKNTPLSIICEYSWNRSIEKQNVFKDLETAWNLLLKETTNMMLKIVFLLIAKSHLPGGRLNGHCWHTHSCIVLHPLRASEPPTEELPAKPNQRETRRLPSRSLPLSGLWHRATTHTTCASVQSWEGRQYWIMFTNNIQFSKKCGIFCLFFEDFNVRILVWSSTQKG